jgi:hypothetical protein
MASQGLKMLFPRIFCWTLLIAMAGLVLITVSPLRSLFNISWDLSNLGLPLGGLGSALLVLTILNSMNGLIKVFMMIAGASGVCWPLNLYLHSLLTIFFPNEPFTFVVAFIVLPLTFVIGTIGALISGLIQLRSR